MHLHVLPLVTTSHVVPGEMLVMSKSVPIAKDVKTTPRPTTWEVVTKERTCRVTDLSPPCFAQPTLHFHTSAIAPCEKDVGEGEAEVTGWSGQQMKSQPPSLHPLLLLLSPRALAAGPGKVFAVGRATA